ncbi:MAG TPA: alpha/beta hydrolase [Candidatus Polarisedimenticolia bacterium]|nr:alpha/beta hydrolase [Candidatus Polarisedimenticolia bacterium]
MSCWTGLCRGDERGPGRRTRAAAAWTALAVLAAAPAGARAGPAGAVAGVVHVASRDGTRLAVECSGSGPELLLVHGGVGDRTRWTPLFPLLSSRFTVCAMDRRGRGGSGDAVQYSIRREAEDIAAVVESRAGPVAVLGHSYGGICALEAAFLTGRISKLLLYEPPLQEEIEPRLVDRIEELARRGDREEAVSLFLREVVRVSPAELEQMRSRPAWKSMMESIGAHPRQMRALSGYRFDEGRLRTLRVPTLLIRGELTAIPGVRRAFDSLMAALPERKEAILAGQHHNAMDTGRQELARTILGFLLAEEGGEP